MYGEDLYDIWASGYSIWAPWVKPVLFAQIRHAPIGSASDDKWRSLDVSWAPPVAQRTALIVDLPGDTAIHAGLALAKLGYFPVVLYNCCAGPRAAIDLEPCIIALSAGEQLLRDLVFDPEAPPAFLLDSRRKRGEVALTFGMFDNRWLVFPQDFPSASFLQSHGINRVIVVQSVSAQPAEDLRHVLLRWQNAGIQVLVAEQGKVSQPIKVTRPSWFRYTLYTMLALIGLHPNSTGGFGSIIPQPSASGG